MSGDRWQSEPFLCPTCGAASWQQLLDKYAYSCLGCGALVTDHQACAMEIGRIFGSLPDQDPHEVHLRIMEMYQSTCIANGIIEA